MDVRDFVSAIEARGWLHEVKTPVSSYLELARVVHALDEAPTIFRHVEGWPHSVVAGLCARRSLLALALGVEEAALMGTLVRALRQARERQTSAWRPHWIDAPPCQECVVDAPDLDALPILTHFPSDGGPYVTSAVVIVRDPVAGLNLAFHRLMRVGSHEFTVRLVEGRGTHTAWQRTPGDLEMVAVIGAPLQVQWAAAMSPPSGVSELAIADSLCATPVARALGSDLDVPAGAEIVLEGRLTKRLGHEGPFVDLTRTRDIVRQQPVFEVDRLTHRRTPIYQALLPGGYEHKLLMGLPREPTMFEAVSDVCHCRNVAVSPGGGYWLHAVVQIEKRTPDDGRLAIEAAFRGHTSLKHVVVVDHDVDATDTEQVEWALATRFQADRDLYLFRDQPSSSLDPSAQHIPGQKARTAKMGLDATIHWDTPSGPARPEDYDVVDYEPPLTLLDEEGP
jgi:2,5-furandicarboxylate decarboxylase 1